MLQSVYGDETVKGKKLDFSWRGLLHLNDPEGVATTKQSNTEPVICGPANTVPVDTGPLTAPFCVPRTNDCIEPLRNGPSNTTNLFKRSNTRCHSLQTSTDATRQAKQVRAGVAAACQSRHREQAVPGPAGPGVKGTTFADVAPIAKAP